LDALAARAEQLDGATVLSAAVPGLDAKRLLDTVDRLKGRLQGAAILLGSASDGRVHLVASVAPELVERGVKAGAIVKRAAAIVGGGGGGRDTMAQAGGRDPDKLDDAIDQARAAIVEALKQ
jgi:alanyl-tRNA synthetase